MRITNSQDLARYLDYCSEMLSLTGKLAALFAQSVNDEVVIEAVNDIENLGSNLSRKIWQKITMIENAARAPARARGEPGRAMTVTSPALWIIPTHEPSSRSRRQSRHPDPLPFGDAGRKAAR